ncbi:unnamed protein product [Clavelina lepadiformis]|uniref:Saccharopine dehydrogenase-like oxidoreductase n=1 Tax=Clavelina lepadiformis TaxID=159417 RepID=A0ABP0GW85_CLALP
MNNYDMVIFGATGFTGKFVVEEVKRIASEESVSFTIAGRNRSKLIQVLQETGLENLSNDIIMADVNDFQSLLVMCKRAKIVLDCVGPYRFFGEQVVRACVEGKANYVDISGEPQFLENMQLKYNDMAEAAGVYIVGACGFDSIPSDMGALFTKQQFPGTLNSIKSYLNILSGPRGAGLHFATYESAVYGISDVSSLKKIRRAFGFKPLPLVGPKLKLEGMFHYSSPLRCYAMHFLGADAAVVRRSQRIIYETFDEPPVQYSMYSCVGSIWSVIKMVIFGSIFMMLAKSAWGRSLLLKHPKFFTGGRCSHEGPSRKQMEETSFTLTMYGEGYSDGNPDLGRKDKPDKKMTVRISAPEPGYIATPICLVQAALVILKETECLPPKGGVFPPGAAFCKTTLINRLQRNRINFAVISN